MFIVFVCSYSVLGMCPKSISMINLLISALTPNPAGMHSVRTLGIHHPDARISFSLFTLLTLSVVLFENGENGLYGMKTTIHCHYHHHLSLVSYFQSPVSGVFPFLSKNLSFCSMMRMSRSPIARLLNGNPCSRLNLCFFNYI